MGVIIVGKINMFEFLMWVIIDNLLYGFMYSLWDDCVLFGGFLGGVGVVCVVGMGFIYYGNDIGGFLWFLVFVCGCVIVKLGFGWVVVYNFLVLVECGLLV